MKAYDSNALRDDLSARGIVPTIPARRNIRQVEYNRDSYRRRHLVENIFAALKQYRGLATRYCKLLETYEALVCLAGWMVATR